MRLHWLKAFFLSFLLLALLPGLRLSAQGNPDWTEPLPPHRVIGNIYYVGSRGLASYLITTSSGHVLINSSLERSVPLIQKSIEALGFKFSDIKILLISHAHWDHCAGSAAIQKATGATYMVMDGDVNVVESGGRTDFQYGGLEEIRFPIAQMDRLLHDKEEVVLGGMILTARKTAGHTKGCTTWTLKVQENGKSSDVVIVGSPNVNPGYLLVSNRAYPEIARDYRTMFSTLKSLPCDVFLGAHGDYYGMQARLGSTPSGKSSPALYGDATDYQRFVTEKEKAFERELKKQSR